MQVINLGPRGLNGKLVLCLAEARVLGSHSFSPRWCLILSELKIPLVWSIGPEMADKKGSGSQKRDILGMCDSVRVGRELIYWS